MGIVNFLVTECCFIFLIFVGIFLIEEYSYKFMIFMLGSFLVTAFSFCAIFLLAYSIFNS